MWRVVAQPGSALVWGASGRWFESSPPDSVRRSVTKADFIYEGFIAGPKEPVNESGSSAAR